jgi:transcriptional regulator with XRE-family HTH domain
VPKRRQRRRPARLPEKLLEIRQKLGLSQGGMSRILGGEETREYISKYENGLLEPPLEVLLAYARLISKTGRGEFLEALIDDSLDLPARIPADPSKHLRRTNKKNV